MIFRSQSLVTTRLDIRLKSVWETHELYLRLLAPPNTMKYSLEIEVKKRSDYCSIKIRPKFLSERLVRTMPLRCHFDFWPLIGFKIWYRRECFLLTSPVFSVPQLTLAFTSVTLSSIYIYIPEIKRWWAVLLNCTEKSLRLINNNNNSLGENEKKLILIEVPHREVSRLWQPKDRLTRDLKQNSWGSPWASNGAILSVRCHRSVRAIPVPPDSFYEQLVSMRNKVIHNRWQADEHRGQCDDLGNGNRWCSPTYAIADHPSGQ